MKVTQLHELVNSVAQEVLGAEAVVQEDGYYYNDFAIIARDLNLYDGIITSTLKKHEIPYFLDPPTTDVVTGAHAFVFDVETVNSLIAIIFIFLFLWVYHQPDIPVISLWRSWGIPTCITIIYRRNCYVSCANFIFC